MQLYIANKNYSSWSLRPWLLLSELGIPFEERLVPFGEGSSWGEFRRFSPTGLVPCLVDGELTVWDSLAITEYLAETCPAVWPVAREARAWARSAAAEMHSGFIALRSRCPMNCGLHIAVSTPDAALHKDLARLEELWQEGLTRFGGPFLAGERFSAVDAFYAPVVFRVTNYRLPLTPHAQAYTERMLALPGMQQWLAAALKEPWRESGHEQECRQAGTLLADHREGATDEA